MNAERHIGQDRVRIDGPLKVTGTAPYAYEQPTDAPLHLYPLTSTVPRGRIRSIDARAAEALPGVQLVLTHENAPKLLVKADPELYILQSPDVLYWGQFIGAVVADTPEIARHAASLVTVTYDEAPFDAHFRPDHPQAYRPRRVNAFKKTDTHEGDVDAALAHAPVTVDRTYTTPTEHHNPIEPHPVTAIWHAEHPLNVTARRLTLYDANQGPVFHLMFLAPMLGLLPAQMIIHTPYVGGSFGTKGMPHAHLILTALAAKTLPGRPVKYAMTRQQMFDTTGYRPQSHQRVRLAASADGRLTALTHDAVAPTARWKEFVEQTATASRIMYAAPNRRTTHRAVPLDIPASMFMRAPGEFTGMFALETAMDELAVTLDLDPIELRRRNEPARDPETGRPWSGRHLTQCLTEGARLFGWDQRPPTATRRRGEWHYGMGVAASTYPDQHLLSTWAAVHYRQGRYHVQLQASDIGTGAWTILAQIAADALQVGVDRIHLEIGRSDLPLAMGAGGSMGTYTWGSSIMAAAAQFTRKYGPTPPEGARVQARGLRPRDFRKYSRHAFGAHFAEVRVSRVTGEVRVTRLLGVYDPGRIINPRTANSQFIGGMTMGLSAALHEESYLDPRYGHVVNRDLAGYHIAAHADVPDIQARWIEHPDFAFGPTGAKGIGEIGIVGVPAAIGNAIYNATGKRLRALPFTPDRLLGADADPVSRTP